MYFFAKLIHSGCVIYDIILCIKAPVFHILANTGVVIVFNSSLSRRYEGDFVAVLICTSLMSNDAEHHFIGLFAIPASSLVFLQIFRPFSLLAFLDVGF